MTTIISQYQIQDGFSGWSGVLELVPRSVDVDYVDERVSVRHVTFKLGEMC